MFYIKSHKWRWQQGRGEKETVLSPRLCIVDFSSLSDVFISKAAFTQREDEFPLGSRHKTVQADEPLSGCTGRCCCVSWISDHLFLFAHANAMLMLTELFPMFILVSMLMSAD